jgi:hypothetical protein
MTAVAVAAAVLALSPTHHACRFAHARTVAKNAIARVFVRSTADDEAWYGGCLYRDGVPRYVDFAGLDVEGAEDEVALVRLAGPYVATADDFVSDAGIDAATVAVMDLRRRARASPLAEGSPIRFRGQARVVHRAPATVADRQHDHVRALVLRRTGSVAWIAQDLVTGSFEVHAISDHRKRLLDQGQAIDPASLALHGTRLTWRDGTTPRAAALP